MVIMYGVMARGSVPVFPRKVPEGRMEPIAVKGQTREKLYLMLYCGKVTIRMQVIPSVFQKRPWQDGLSPIYF